MFNNSWFKKEAPLFTGLHFGFGGGGASAETPDPVSSSGGSSTSTTDRSGWRLHYFPADTPSPNCNITWTTANGSPLPGVEYLIIGGGGCGGDFFGPKPGYNAAGGGGGAGGMLSGTKTIPATGTYAVVIGEAGTSIADGIASPDNEMAKSGYQSSIAFETGTITAQGGGAGGNGNAHSDASPKNQAGQPGASGGGACRDTHQTAGEGNKKNAGGRESGTSTNATNTPQGNDGGNYGGQDGHGGGGGGAGGAALSLIHI